MSPTPAAITTPERRGPVEGETVLGFDRGPERRPGVPKAAPAHPQEAVAGRPILTQQEQRDRRLHRKGLDEMTPVFGTAQPYRGVSGAIRKAAYRIPEHDARHWMLLILADRVDVTEDRLGGITDGTLRSATPSRLASGARDHPLLTAGAAVAGVWLAKKLLA